MEKWKSFTPVTDFARAYNEKGVSRFHMPGHKGKPILGCEPYDITEINGADVLSDAKGILAESQKLASSVFRTGRTFFSAEGSSLCIKAMLCAVLQEARSREKCLGRGCVVAARNVHRSFVDACALLDLDMVSTEEGAGGKNTGSICNGFMSADGLRRFFENRQGTDGILAVYVTSVDYLGNMADISGIAAVCDRFGVPLAVDNAHGAYLAFLNPCAVSVRENAVRERFSLHQNYSERFYQNQDYKGEVFSMHPIHNGAAICCDSAHKTLPVLTGGAYLHISREWEDRFSPYISSALALFGSTSPSYLILQSLDMCNGYLSVGYRGKLRRTVAYIDGVKETLKNLGILYLEGEPLKIVIDVCFSGYTGNDIADEMRNRGIECEYADKNYVVLMATPENDEGDFLRLEEWAQNSVLRGTARLGKDMPSDLPEDKADGNSDRVKCSLSGIPCTNAADSVRRYPRRVMSIRDAVFAPSEIIPVNMAQGRICAAQTVSCPPAVPIAISGEEIDDEAVLLFQKYGIHKVCVVKEDGF